MEENPLEQTPSVAPPTRKKLNKRFIYLIAAIVVLFLLFLGYKFLNSNKTASTTSTTTTFQTPTLGPTDSPTPTTTSPTDSPTVAPTDTPTPEPTLDPVDPTTGLDRSKLSITVENGSGQAGVGAKGASFLTHLGYNVTSTTNADNYNYTNVTIQVKSADSDYLSLLQSDLGSSYTVGTTSSDLDDGFSSDALVIIGQ